MRRLILIVALALMLVVSFTVPVFAASSDTVAVTATPKFVSIDVTPVTYAIGGAGAKILISTTYYANPGGATTPPSGTVLLGECAFLITNTSTVSTAIVVNFPHFANGDAMTNINTGYLNNGANAFGVSGYVEGLTWPGGAVILQNAGSANLIASLGAGTNKSFGWALKTKSNEWSSGTAMTTTVTVTDTGL